MADVVDADCRVHGMANLYVGGSSVFATTGHPNHPPSCSWRSGSAITWEAQCRGSEARLGAR